jgi:hypothetical protein
MHTMTGKITRLVVIRAVVVLYGLIVSTIAYPGPLILQPSDSSAGREVSMVARDWMNALLRKDFETLASLSVPEYQEGMRRGLSDKQSRIYRALYISKNSPFRKFRDIRDVAVAVLTHRDLQYAGQGTTACFFDSRNPPHRWPNDSASLPSIERRADVYCIFLNRSTSAWEVSTDFADYDY